VFGVKHSRNKNLKRIITKNPDTNIPASVFRFCLTEIEQHLQPSNAFFGV